MNYMMLNYIIKIMIMMMTFFSLSMSDLFMLWMMMEMSNFLFIFLMSTSMKNKKMIFFYFIIQIIPSLTMILNISINLFNWNKFSVMMILLSLYIKLGLPPMHFWVPVMAPYMDWPTILFLLTVQKFIPMYMLSMMVMNKYILSMELILCSLIPPMMMMKLTNLKKLISYSSINQMSWILLLMYMKSMAWLSYMIMYSLIMMFMLNIIHLNKLFKYFLFNPSNINIIILNMMMNLAMMPPFSFFFLKFFSIYLLIFNSNMYLILLIMLISSLIMIYLYINMLYLMMFTNMMKSKLLQMNLPWYKSLFSTSFFFFFSSFSIIMLMMI